MPIANLVAMSEKRLGYNVVQTANTVPEFKHVSTGSFTLDLALLGGIPEGLCTMLIGKQHSGKSLMAMKTAGNFQRKYDGVKNPKKYVVWFQVGEGIFPKAWAEANGVNTDELYIITPPDGDAAVDMVCATMEEEDVCLVIFDAVPGLVGTKELAKSAEDALAPGAVAGPLQRMLRKVSSTVAKSHVTGELKTLILINQWRAGIGSTPNVPRAVPGGKYARHYNSVEVELYNTEVAGAGENEIKIISHNDHSFKIHKNKTGNSIREGEFRVVRVTDGPLPAGTVDDFATVTTYGKKFGFIGGAGTGWWMISQVTGEELRFKSKGLIEDFITQNPEEYTALKNAIIGKHRRTQGLSDKGWGDF